MKIFKIVAAILLLLTGCSQSVSNSSEVPIKISDRVDLKFSELSPALTFTPQSHVQKRVRKAAVKITNIEMKGHGSGSYVSYKGIQLVITALHVVDEMDPVEIIVMGIKEQVPARLIYADPINDIAILLPRQKITSRTPFPLKFHDNTPDVGAQLTYTGFPSNHQMLTFAGNIVGFEEVNIRYTKIRQAIVIHTYGWFGSSGSCLFDSTGHLVGILWGVDVEIFMVPQAQEDIIYASHANTINMDLVMDKACITNMEKEVCKRHERRRIKERFNQ